MLRPQTSSEFWFQTIFTTIAVQNQIRNKKNYLNIVKEENEKIQIFLFLVRFKKIFLSLEGVKILHVRFFSHDYCFLSGKQWPYKSIFTVIDWNLNTQQVQLGKEVLRYQRTLMQIKKKMINPGRSRTLVPCLPSGKFAAENRRDVPKKNPRRWESCASIHSSPCA